MLEYKVKINDSVFIRWQGTSIDTGLYPQVKIYNIDAPTTVIDTLDLPHLGSGLYGIKWTPTAAGKYFTQTIIYSTNYGVDESGVDRPDSDSINVEDSSGGAGGYLLGSGQTIDKNKYKGLTDEELKKIIDGVYEKIKPDLIKAEDIKITIPEQLDYSNQLKFIGERISKIKFDYKFDDTLLIESMKSLSNKVDITGSLLMSAVENALKREIKIEKNITNVLNQQTGDDGEDDDMVVAKDIFSNPKKRFDYTDSSAVSARISKHSPCISLTNTLKDSGVPAFKVFSPLTIDS